MIDTRSTATPEHTSHPLNEFVLSLISANAARVYKAVWEEMSHKNKTELWLSDSDVSRRSRVMIQFIPACQSELLSACPATTKTWVRAMHFTYVGFEVMQLYAP